MSDGVVCHCGSIPSFLPSFLPPPPPPPPPYSLSLFFPLRPPPLPSLSPLLPFLPVATSIVSPNHRGEAQACWCSTLPRQPPSKLQLTAPITRTSPQLPVHSSPGEAERGRSGRHVARRWTPGLLPVPVPNPS